ncbi:MAG: biopolymer transporter ExbD, partial [Bacteroidales bacterium]
DVSQLRDKAVEFLTNPANSDNLPERESKMIEGFGNYPISKGVISLQNTRGTSYKAYISVQNELVRAVNEIRNDFARQNFGKAYASLDEEKQAIVREAIPQNISEAEPRDTKK